MNLLLASIEIIRPLNVILSLTAVIISSYLVNAMNYTRKYKKLYIMNCYLSNNDVQKKLLIWLIQ